MNDIALKYNLLDEISKKEINDFIDFLLSKRKIDKDTLRNAYKQKILTVSNWEEKDIAIFETNAKFFNNWKIEQWYN